MHATSWHPHCFGTQSLALDEPKHVLRFEPKAAVVSKRRSLCLPVVNAVGTTPCGTNWRQAGRFRKMSGKHQPKKHVCLWYGRSQRRPQAPQFATRTACTSEFRTQTSLFVEASVDALIDTQSRIRSRIPVSTHTPATSAAIAVPNCRGPAI